jgi:hypothetical protein
VADFEDGEWWPQFANPPPMLLGDEFMDIELALDSPTVKLRAGDEIKMKINHWTQGDIKFVPERPCYIKFKIVYKGG